MSFFRTAILVCPAACLLAQTPPPASPPTTQTPAQTAQPPATRQATPVPPSPQTATPANGRKVNPDGSVTLPFKLPAPPAQVPPETVVLTVGDFTLTAKQFDEIADGLQEQYRAFVKGPGRKQFADQVVRVLVMAQEGKKRGVDQSPTFKTQAMFQSDQVLASAAAQKVSQEVKVDDAALHKYYDEHKAEYEQIHARHILIRFQGSQVPVKPGGKDLTDAEALAKAQDLDKQLKGGADFAKLATDESDDTSSARMGGDLGVFPHGKMVPSFDEAAFKLKAGEISDPVKSQFGYHIIKVESIENKGFDDVKAEIEKKLRPQLANQAMEEIQKNTKVVYDPTFFGTAKQ
jgi:peptidyl-prolyl cis-trans isomerase C